MSARFSVTTVAVCLLLLGARGETVAQQVPHSQPQISAWARATPPGARVGVAYLTIASMQNDRLLRVSSPVSPQVSLHAMTMHGNVMTMAGMPDGLALPAGQTVVMQPGGDHLMLENLRAPLRMGGSLSLHLVFQHAPAMDIQAPIAGMAATAAPTP